MILSVTWITLHKWLGRLGSSVDRAVTSGSKALLSVVGATLSKEGCAMNVLVPNSRSSSLKVQLIAIGQVQSAASGLSTPN